MASLDMLPQYIIDELIQQMEEDMKTTITGRFPEQDLLDYVRDQIGDFGNITNGYQVALDFDELIKRWPVQWKDPSKTHEELIGEFLHRSLGLRCRLSSRFKRMVVGFDP